MAAPTAMQLKADSVSSSERDYDAERAALLAQADAARREADAISLSSEAAAALQRGANSTEVARKRGTAASEEAQRKIAEQQDRFVAGVVAAGLDPGLVEVESGSRPKAATTAAKPNKYATLASGKK